ncbi:urease accessory protein UreD [Phormidium sp. CLA17]|uniref:urease accessory protein UreD n=1 Tax=Leptolyngbya sp. Cla-17 TaxID=2803751 RepID=UPI001491BC02|nr:urease accessory protein UreD [Leptolyngbya sp. Cla-17]MBM0741982.1 urease accessory protein UreD [Leptolyngbya sp. Cla-17]
MTSPFTQHWHGRLHLNFARQGNATCLTFEQVKAPLKVQRPFYPEGEAVCHSVILHTAGGIVGGDRLSLDIHLQPQAQALITTAAAAKLYGSTGLEAQQSVQIYIAEGACLEWLPQETIVFDQAIYRQDMRIDLAPGASWLGWDITRFGRTARGEKFVQGNWRSQTEIWQRDRPLWIDRQWLPGCEEAFDSPHGLGGYPIVGNFAFVGQIVETDLVEKARSLWLGTSGEIGVTRLLCGLLCRYRGNSTMEARQWLMAVWQLVRSTHLQRSACTPRVWQL